LQIHAGSWEKGPGRAGGADGEIIGIAGICGQLRYLSNFGV